MRKITNWPKNVLHGFLALFLTFTMTSQSWGQVLVDENFNYTIGSLLTDNGWINHSGTSGFITVTDGLSFAGYIDSGIGGAAGLDENGEDVHVNFEAQTSGSVYAAMIIKTSATNSSGYFFHFGQNPWDFTYYTRLWVNATGDAVGIGTSVTTWVPITPGTPTLVVVKFNIDTKESSLYVFNAFPTSEPATADANYTETSTSIVGVGGIGLRQFNAAENVVVDGIRVATTWADAVAAAGASTEANILTFTLAEQTGDATFNTTDHTVSIEVANGTAVTALIPTITISTGATINPESGVAQDFTNPVTYTVTAEDGTTTQDWVVTVTVAPLLNNEADVLTFSFPEEVSPAVINTTDTTITSVVKWDADLAQLVPTFTISEGAQVSATTTPLDFNNPVTYRVISEDMSVTKDWVVTVTKAVEPQHGVEIKTFELASLSEAATIDSASATVTGVLVAGTNVTSLTPTITVSEGAQVTPTSVQDFTNPVVYTVTAEDGETTKDWTVTLTVLPTPEVTIHDIQYTTDASGDSPYKDQTVQTKGLVYAKDNYGVYMQDGSGAWSGIYVYGSTDPVIGDSVLVVGQVVEYSSVVTEFNKPTVTILNSGNTIAGPTSVTVADFNTEQYEGVLVKLSDVVCASEVSSKAWKVVQNGTTDSMIVYNKWYDYTPTLGEVYSSLVGIGTQYKTDYELYPRDADDIVVTSISDDQLALVRIYPNPVSDELTMENLDGVSTVLISNILGQTVNTFNVKANVMRVDLSNLNKGIYIVTLKSADGTMRSERIIKK